MRTHMRRCLASAECLAIYVARRIRARDALEVFADLMARHGVPRYSRSDKGPEMIAKVTAAMAETVGYRDNLHHAGSSLGERLLRIVQRQTAGRITQRRNLYTP